MKVHEESDEHIAAIAQQGDTDAYEALMSRYEERLLRYAAFILHDSSLAADVVQETFIKAYQNLKGYDPRRKFSSWIYRIAHNQAIDAIRKEHQLTDTEINERMIPAYEPTVSDDIDAKLLNADVQECVGKLSARYREVVQLVYLEGMGYTDASDVLHIPTSTVGTWLSRAKRELREICDAQGVKYE